MRPSSDCANVSTTTAGTTPRSEADAEVVDFIAERASPDRADRVLDELVDSMRKLADMPRVRRDLAPDDGVRFWPVFGFLIAYCADTAPLQVLRVVHGSRHPERIAGLLGDEDAKVSLASAQGILLASASRAPRPRVA